MPTGFRLNFAQTRPSPTPRSSVTEVGPQSERSNSTSSSEFEKVSSPTTVSSPLNNGFGSPTSPTVRAAVNYVSTPAHPVEPGAPLSGLTEEEKQFAAEEGLQWSGELQRMDTFTTFLGSITSTFSQNEEERRQKFQTLLDEQEAEYLVRESGRQESFTKDVDGFLAVAKENQSKREVDATFYEAAREKLMKSGWEKRKNVKRVAENELTGNAEEIEKEEEAAFEEEAQKMDLVVADLIEQAKQATERLLLEAAKAKDNSPPGEMNDQHLTSSGTATGQTLHNPEAQSYSHAPVVVSGTPRSISPFSRRSRSRTQYRAEYQMASNGIGQPVRECSPLPMTRSRGPFASTNDPDYERRIQEALKDIANGICKTKTAAAKRHGIARSTLSGRSTGLHGSRRKASEQQQLLSPAEEEAVVSWLKLNSSTANPLHPKQLNAVVFDITGKVPGRNWHRRFIERHEETIKTATARRLDPKRAENFRKSTIDGYFMLRKDLQEEYGDIPPEHNWNMDERGNVLGGGRKGNGMKYIFGREDVDRYRQRSDNLELMTVIECANAAGTMMEPFFILKEGPLPNPDDPRLDGVAAIATSPNGWTDNELARLWFTEVFIPQAEKHRVNDKPIVLTLDGHGSHESDDIKDAAYSAGDSEGKDGVVILALPSKTTHKTQPLDVGVFCIIDRKWTSHVDERLAVGVSMDRYNVIQEYMSIRHVMTPEIVRKAFEKTGIHPLNPDVFTDNEFAPSALTSTSVADHLPSTYPPDIPTSPIIPDSVELPDASPAHVGDEDSDDVQSEAGSDSDLDSEYTPHARESRGHDDSCSESESESDVQVDSDEDDLRSLSDDNEDDEEPLLSGSRHIRTRSVALEEDLDEYGAGGGCLSKPPPLPSYDQVMQASRIELWKLIQYMYKLNKSLSDTLEEAHGQLQASNAHCTIAGRKIANIIERLENTRKKRGKSFKINARFVTLPRMRAEYTQQREAQKKKDEEEAQKQAQKKADDIARKAQVEEDIKNQIFDEPLSSYKKKDDLLALAGALDLSQQGSCDDLSKRIKQHVTMPDVSSNLKTNPRFCGLFSTRRRRAAPACSQPVASSSAPPQPPQLIQVSTEPLQIAPQQEVNTTNNHQTDLSAMTMPGGPGLGYHSNWMGYGMQHFYPAVFPPGATHSHYYPPYYEPGRYTQVGTLFQTDQWPDEPLEQNYHDPP